MDESKCGEGEEKLWRHEKEVSSWRKKDKAYSRKKEK